jgi:DNA processing protein
MVAIVGSRKVSPYGRLVTQLLAAKLARTGVVIVSGLALGVDSIAHQAALDAGGTTIAVLPCGIDKIYPSSHFHLANKIIRQGGALVSEYPMASESPMKYQFIARNRIIAGLSQRSTHYRSGYKKWEPPYC